MNRYSELYKFGSSSENREYSLELIINEQLIPELLKKQNIDTCFRITEYENENRIDFRINEILMHSEEIRIPKTSEYETYKKFTFKERIKILFRGNLWIDIKRCNNVKDKR